MVSDACQHRSKTVLATLTRMVALTPLDYLPPWGVFLATVAVTGLCIEIGYRFGVWRRQRCQLEKDAPVGALIAATLGLLGFMLATTFSIAVSRFELRLKVTQNLMQELRRSMNDSQM